MKSIITITVLLLLLSFQTFSQDKSHKRVLLERFTIEKLMEMHKSNIDALEGLIDNKYWLLKSKNRRWEQVSRNQQEGFYIKEGFNIKDSRTKIKKTSLDDGFLLLEIINQTWDGSTWVNSLKFSYIYDGNNSLTESLYQTWDGSAWVNFYKSSNTYDGNNNLTEGLLQSWDGSAWVNSFKTSYTYDGNNNRTEILSQEWDGSAWMNNRKSSITFDENNNLIEWLDQYWVGFAWVNSWKDSNTFDGNNNLTESLYQTWDGSAWVNSRKGDYTYDGNNNLTESLYQTWDGSDWLNISKEIYSYIPTGIERLANGIKTYSLSNNYPNPFNPSTMIEFSVPVNSNVTLIIYNSLGQVITTLVNEEISAGSYSVIWNGTDKNGLQVSSGVYLYKMQGNGNNSNSYSETKKMILLK